MSDLAIWYPIGTLPEIKAMGLPPNTTASCSLQMQGNRGCPWFSKCRFREIRDGVTPKGHKLPLAGPENVAVYVQLSQGQGGAVDIKMLPCSDYYQSGLHERWRNMENSGEVIKVLGVAGNGREYTMQETRKLHIKKDPNCQACAANNCFMHEAVRAKRPIPRFPRPSESMGQLSAGADIREEVLAEVRAEMEREALHMDESDPLEVSDAKARAG